VEVALCIFDLDGNVAALTGSTRGVRHVEAMMALAEAKTMWKV